MPLPLLAIPVVHSAGGWIASAGGSYLGGTLASTWAGSFILGNSALLSGIGIGATSVGAGVAAVASGAGAAVSAGAAATSAAAVSAATSAGVALGIVTPTFLGLTPIGWAVTGAVLSLGAAGFAVWRYRHRDTLSLIEISLPEINIERVRGGLEPVRSASDLIRELFKKPEQ